MKEKKIFHEKKQRNWPWYLLTVFACGLLAVGIAFIWQNQTAPAIVAASSAPESVSSEESSSQETSLVAVAPESSEDSSQTSSLPVESSTVTTSATDLDTSSTQTPVEPTSVAYTPRPNYANALAATDAVSNSYFDDAIFLGDSITTGIPLYLNTVLPNAAVVAERGLTPDNALTKQVFANSAGANVTMLEKAKDYGERSKVYIMFGGNALWMSDEQFVSGYRSFVQAVQKQYPNAVIYLQSITPVTSTVGSHYKDVSNTQIDHFNVLIMDLATEMGVSYLDIAAAMVNSSGELPTEASPYDGMHFTADYYYIWLDYLKTHTVKK